MSELSMDRYAAYKDSGVEWLGEIPEHWVLDRLKNRAKTQSGTTPQSGRSEYYDSGTNYWVRTTDLNNGHLHNSEYKITDLAVKKCGLKSIPVNSVLIAMYGGMGTIGKNSLLRNSVTINQSVCAVLPNERKFNSIYLWYYVQYFRPHWEMFADSARKDPNINQEAIKRLWLLLPPLSEQEIIANYLDTKTAQIDRKIGLLSQKAEKYGKLKQSLINETVTRGLDKSVPMKDSGIEWIGDVPAHWVLHRGVNFLRLGSDQVTTSEMKCSKVFHYSIPMVQKIGTGCIEDGSDIDSSKLRIKGNEILFSKLNPRKETVCITSKLLSGMLTVCSGEFLVMKPIKGCSSLKFCYYLFKASFNKERICSTVKSVTKSHQRANPLEIHKMSYAFPPLQEQKNIAAHLNEKTSKIDRIIKTINSQINNLKALRKTLINDVVRGKIKVVDHVSFTTHN